MTTSSQLVSLVEALKDQINGAGVKDLATKQSILHSIDTIESNAKQLFAKYEIDTDTIESKLQSMSDDDILAIIDQTASAIELHLSKNDLHEQLQLQKDNKHNLNHSRTDDYSSNDKHRKKATKTLKKTNNNADIIQTQLLKVGDFTFPVDRTGLIMIDFQRDFLLPGGFGQLLGNDVKLLHSAIEPAKKVLECARSVGMTIIHTLESHLADLSDVHERKLKINDEFKIGDKGPMGRIMIRNEYGNNIIDSLKPLKNSNEKIIYKPGKGSFYKTELFHFLKSKNIQHLIFAGVTTEVCVFSTMCEARDRGFYTLLITDATASYFQDFKKSIEKMIVAQNHIVGWTATSSQLIHVLNKYKNTISNQSN